MKTVTQMTGDDVAALFNYASSNLLNVVRLCTPERIDKIADCVIAIQASVLYGITAPGTLEKRLGEIRATISDLKDSPVVTAFCLFNSSIHVAQSYSATGII